MRHGGYRTVGGGADQGSDPHAAERRLAVDHVRAVHRQLVAPHVFSHESAALLWGCALWRAPARTHVVQGYRASGRAAADVARHRTPVPADQHAEIDGMPVTSLERTVVDCALTMPPLDALVVADSALRHGLDLGEARAILAGSRARNGRRRATWVLEHADAGAQSPWETWLRYVCLRAGMPRPATQVPVPTRLGEMHCDIGWPEWGLLAEFDGRSKYRDGALGAAHDGTTELLREKRRYEAIREAGHDPVRVLAVGGAGVDQVVQRLAARFPPDVRRTFRVNPMLPPP
ncbi:hypothetical protein [Isoptericola sp. NPDC057653]|uniref:hypothetical protein n=1 Tax=Isoptericola sp. NPDC057653 TaxID=3346195 RepID=UPI0036B5FA8C